MGALATVEDYVARYGEPADRDRVETLLQDASDLMLSAFEEARGPYEPGAYGPFDRSARAVCCMVANRVLSAPAALAGATQYSQSAISYSASVTYGSALGEMYLGKSDLRRLGLAGQVRRCLHPREASECS